MKHLKLFASTLVLSALLASPAFSADEKKAEKKPDAGAYPLKTCIVSDEKLGDMGDPYVFKHEGRDVKLCCEGCLKDFKKNPAKYIAKLDKAQKPAAKK